MKIIMQRSATQTFCLFAAVSASAQSGAAGCRTELGRRRQRKSWWQHRLGRRRLRNSWRQHRLWRRRLRNSWRQHGPRCGARRRRTPELLRSGGMVRRQPAGAACEASPCSAVTAEPALAMPLARLSQLSPGCDPGARSRVMGTPCYALPKHARREKGICRSPLMVGIDKFDYLR